MSIHARRIEKSFNGHRVLDGIDLHAPGGSLVALLGPSGSGKTTLLRIIAGLDQPDAGEVHYANGDVTRHPVRERNVGFVFQHYALFRHMTVFENVAFGLRVRGWSGAKVRDRVGELLRLVRLEELAGRYPSQLSGGQKQRIALVRALAAEPKILLLDEPFGALDAKVRVELRQWLRRFHDEFHVTSIFVTHDHEEAFEVADRVVIMNKGRVEQAGTPAEVFEHPANAFVMDFLGNVNVFPYRMQDGQEVFRDLDLPEVPGSGERHVYIRPHELTINRVSGGTNSLEAQIVHINPAGSVVKVRLVIEEFGLMVNVDLSPDHYRELELKAEDRVYVSPKQARVFAPEYNI